MAQENTELAKIILQNVYFLNMLTQPSQYSGITDLSIVASSNIETAKWIFKMPFIVKKIITKDLNSMVNNDGQHDVIGSTMKNLYDNFVEIKKWVKYERKLEY